MLGRDVVRQAHHAYQSRSGGRVHNTPTTSHEFDRMLHGMQGTHEVDLMAPQKVVSGLILYSVVVREGACVIHNNGQ